jgi:hypothetical protein
MQGKQCGLWAGLYMTARFDPTHTIRSLVTPRNSNWEALTIWCGYVSPLGDK